MIFRTGTTQSWTANAQKLIGFGMVLFLIGFLSGCAGAIKAENKQEIAEENLFIIVVEQESDSIIPRGSANQLIFEIRSETGIGTGLVESSSGRFPSQTFLRFFLPSLEELVFRYEQIELRISVPAQQGGVPIRTLHRKGKPPVTVPPFTSYWMAIRQVEADQPSQDSFFEVSLPPDFYAQESTVFEIAWIDFYR